MANLSGLVQEIGERIAGKGKEEGEEELEGRFRAVLPGLVKKYVIPTAKAKEREVIAILKLLAQTANNFPGVFDKGKGTPLLPIIARIIPFFAIPSFLPRHPVIFESLLSLLSSLRISDVSAYRLFFFETRLLLQSLLQYPHPHPPCSIYCFQLSFTHHILLPQCITPSHASSGISIHLSSIHSFPPFAASLINILSKYYSQTTLYPYDFPPPSFLSLVCSMLNYADSHLHMACFDFARILATASSLDIVSEQLIRSIAIILSNHGDVFPIFKESMYDSCVGRCLHTLYSSCTDNVVRSTALDFVNVIRHSLQKTSSIDLKVALSGAYVRICRICSPRIWMLESLIPTICSSAPVSLLKEYLQAVFSRFGYDPDGNVAEIGGKSDLADSGYKKFQVGEKRPTQGLDLSSSKRQKSEDGYTNLNIGCQNVDSFVFEYTGDPEHADYMQNLLTRFVDLLKPPSGQQRLLRPELALRAISSLCIVCCEHSNRHLSVHAIRLLLQWFPWMFEQVVIVLCSLPSEAKLFGEGDAADLIKPVLEYPWSHSLGLIESLVKSLSVQVFTKIGLQLQNWIGLDILDLALHDEAEEVRMEAISSMPIIVLWSGFGFLTEVFKKLLILEEEKSVQARKIIPFALGYLACLYSSCDPTTSFGHTNCKLYLKGDNKNENSTVDTLTGGFWCSKCDIKFIPYNGLHSIVPEPLKVSSEICDLNCDYDVLQSLFFRLLFDESQVDVQVACVAVIHRILLHGTADMLSRRRCEWLKCVDALLLHKEKAIRDLFRDKIGFFIEESILNCLFAVSDATSKTKEQKFMDIIKHALAEADDPELLISLMEVTAEIMRAASIHSQLFFLSLILLIDQLDNPVKIAMATASYLIRKSCVSHLEGGLEEVLSKIPHIQNELYGFLSLRLGTRPIMVEEFSTAILGVETEALVKKMIPLILPKLIVAQHDDCKPTRILDDYARCLRTDVVQLIMTWLPKVLAFALNQADGQDLLTVLQFYQERTKSGKKEIFEVAIPELLIELVCFTDELDSSEGEERLERVPHMIEEVARILTDKGDLPGFLRIHFVYLLNSIDRKMLQTGDILLQKQAMRCIKMLISMMGSHLSTYVPKLMVLLMRSIDKEPLLCDGLSVLHFFLKQLEMVSPSSTKHVISQVFAALVPVLERDKDNSSIHLNEIVVILDELVLENRIILKQHISEFPPLPSIPALTEVNKVIQEARGVTTLIDELRGIVDGLNHENLNVRYMVACELSKVLNIKRDEITTLFIKEGDPCLDVLSSLITSLLRGCAEESRTSVGQRLKLVSADCLGALGAIDPAKVRMSSSIRFKIACSDDDLIFELIHKHLARAFRAAPSTIIQDSAALAIQELLKIAGCGASLDENFHAKAPASSIKSSGDRSNGRGQRLWDRFSNYVKEIIAPCLTSRFELPNATDFTSSGPIYRPSMSFRSWVFSWIKKLIVHATGSRGCIFYACRGIVRHDMQIAMYLLPYLVLDAVCHSTEEARSGITEEILCVLDAAASDHTSSTIQGIGSGQNEVCMQAVFSLLDNLGQWVDDVDKELAFSQSLQPYNSKQHASTLKDHNVEKNQNEVVMQCRHVSGLLAAIPKVTLARASSRCQAYARSFLYFESHVREKSGSFNLAAETSGQFEDNDVSFLMEIYSGLDEPDGLSGLAWLRKFTCLQDHILINKKAGNWAEVLMSCEQALQMEPHSVQRHSDVLNCLLNMCHLQAMVTHVDGLISKIPEYKKTWCMQGVQAAWRLSRWDLMDEYLSGAEEEGLVCNSSESNASFDMDVAKILQGILKKDPYAVAEKIAMSKQALIAPLAAAGMDSYSRAYPFVVKLHMLRELEDFNSVLGGESFLDKKFDVSDLKVSTLLGNWEDRLRLTQQSLWAREPLLAFRRLVFCANSFGAHVGSCWLQYAKLCRSAGHYETANRAILEASASGAPSVHMEKAKLLWSTRRAEGAIAELQQSLLSMPSEMLGSNVVSSITTLSLVPRNSAPLGSSVENQDLAKTLLLYSRWIHYTGLKQKEDVINLYSRVKELQPQWEKGYFYMAKYCDELLVDARKRQEGSADHCSRPYQSNSSLATSASLNSEKHWWYHLPDVLLFYAKGLHRGHKNLFQALPRLLTLWFDFGSMYQRNNSSSNITKKSSMKMKETNVDMKNVHSKAMSIMRGCLKDLPTYQWLTVLPQLVSRICHQNKEIVCLVKSIITTVLRNYPQQALWSMAAVTKSTVSSRRDAAAEIIQAARRGSQGGGNSLFVQFTSLIDHLIKLCFHSGQAKARTINILTDFSSLKRMMPVEIIMPTQQSLTVNLPSYDLNQSSGSIDIFSMGDLPTISGIADEAEILSSLQRPKKIILLGSDGIERPFLCKPKDDLRKDARMMEFNAMINRLLSKCPESRRRKLYIRTFAVIPLMEDCGMVEWVPHTRGLRHILQDIYISCGKFDRQKTNPQIKRIYDQCQGKVPEEEMLRNKILPMFPPVFHKWFLNTFSEPAAWFRARVAYAHTTAVWSMVGHIVGLGDRHGENILFDSTTGDCVHVDFSCLFDKGLLLEKPELVPFRLTQNIIDGLGITGYEGIFMRVSEITLSVLRGHKETLMSVLETFIHDPLVEWTKSHKSSGIEVENPQAQQAISKIEARLQGVVVGVGAAPSLPLSVEGQARRLIAEAVSHRNLGKMYIWWMPWF
ncbi:non-receptor serine/threonine protein kinase [Lithospermum erythrorhizon]|uniref:Serine/threonine-protein kinase ATR n=1 Tax=Lithospermum erythrorhizon TaxID=34254 RepID=A0AAV3P3M7_LITER